MPLRTVLVLILFCLPALPLSRGDAQETTTTTPGDRAFLGLFTEPVPEADFGVRVTHVVPFSAAQTMGLQVGDVVLAVNDVLLADPAALRNELSGLNVGSTLRFLLERGGEKTRLKGKIGSFLKTMAAYQQGVRGRTVGKPLQAPPHIRWWDAASQQWKEDAGAFEKLKGHVAIVFSFDDCAFCMRHKFGRFSTLDKQLGALGDAAPMKVVGIFFSADRDAKESYKTAEAILAKSPVSFPLGVASYPEGAKPSYEEQVLLHRHGIAILNAKGSVDYIQVHGVPGSDFVKAYEAALKEATAQGAKSG